MRRALARERERQRERGKEKGIKDRKGIVNVFICNSTEEIYLDRDSTSASFVLAMVDHNLLLINAKSRAAICLSRPAFTIMISSQASND